MKDSSVKRYGVNYGGRMDVMQDGEYVLFTHYATLEREKAAAEENLNKNRQYWSNTAKLLERIKDLEAELEFKVLQHKKLLEKERLREAVIEQAKIVKDLDEPASRGAIPINDWVMAVKEMYLRLAALERGHETPELMEGKQ